MPTVKSAQMERRKFEMDFLCYEWIKFCLFIGKSHAFVPRFSRGLDRNSFDEQFKRILEYSSDHFTRFWSKMTLPHTKCLIVDGCWKLRRAICANKSVYRNTLVFDRIQTGCPNTRMSTKPFLSHSNFISILASYKVYIAMNVNHISPTSRKRCQKT